MLCSNTGGKLPDMAYPQRNVDAPAEKSCQLYVKNFGNGLNDKSLHSLFSRYGKVRSASVCHDRLWKYKLLECFNFYFSFSFSSFNSFLPIIFP